MLAIFHIRELAGSKREIVVRACSASDAAGLVAKALDVDPDPISDPTRFKIDEVNYGEDFRSAGPRGVIVRF